MNRAATRPRMSTCATPWAPTLVYPASDLQELQRPGDRGVVGGLDLLGHRPGGDRPQGGHRLHRGERQVEPGHRAGVRAGLLRDEPGQLPRVQRVPAVLFGEHLPGDLGADPGPLVRRDRVVVRVPVDLVPGAEPLRQPGPPFLACPRTPGTPGPAGSRRTPAARWRRRRTAPAMIRSASGWMPCPNRFSICCSVTAPLVPSASRPRPHHCPGDSPFAA